MEGLEADGPHLPALGSRVSIHQEAGGGSGGRWLTASVAQLDGHDSLPAQLEYEDGSLAWARFVGSNVLLAWHPPKSRGRRPSSAGAAPTKPPPDALTVVLAFMPLADDTKIKGRPSNAMKDARKVALNAAKAYDKHLRKQQLEHQQRSGGGPSDDTPGSPAKRRKLDPAQGSAAAVEPSGEAADAEQQQLLHGARQAGTGERAADEPAGGKVHAGTNGKLASPAVGAKRRLRQASPAAEAPAAAQDGRQAEAASMPVNQAASAEQVHRHQDVQQAAAASTDAQQPQQQQQQQKEEKEQQQEDQQQEHAAEAQEDGRSCAATEEQQAPHNGGRVSPGSEAGAGGSQATQPAAAAAPSAAAAAAAAALKRPAVTDLGGHTFKSLGLARPAEAKSGLSAGSSRTAADGSQAAGRQRERSQLSARKEAGKEQGRRADSGPRPGKQPGSRPEASATPVAQPLASAGSADAEEAAAAAAAAVQPKLERRGDAACQRLAALLPELKGFKDSIRVAAVAAIEAGREGACREAVLCVIDYMDRRVGAGNRLPYFYLLDAVLAHSRKKELEGCGPDSQMAQHFSRTVGAALGRLVDVLGANLDDAQKMERTLANTWSAEDKRGVSAALVQRALQKLRERIAQHEAAWGGGGGGAAAGAPAAAGGRSGSGGGDRRGKAADAGAPQILDEQGLAQMMRRMGMRDVPVLTYTNIKDGSKVKLTHRVQPEVMWPDYATLPLPAGAERDQHGSLISEALAAAAHEPPGKPASPWHSTLDASGWEDGSEVAAMAQQAAMAAQWQHLAQHQAAQRVAVAAHAQRAQQQRLLLQQQAAQSTAATAEADEFDMGLFKEAAGGVAAVPAHLAQAAGALPDLLQPLGEAPWGLGTVQPPPLPDQSPPPLPEDGYGPPGSYAGDWDDEEDLGPPPLPPHSPPRDEYEMDVEEEEEAPPPLPPEDSGAAATPAAARAPQRQQEVRQQQQQQTMAGGQHAAAGAGAAAAWAAFVPPGFLPPPPNPQPAAAARAAAAAARAAAAAASATASAAAYPAQPTGWPSNVPPPAVTPQQHPQQLPPAPMLPPGIGISATPQAGMAAPQQLQPLAQQGQHQAFLMGAMQAAHMQQHAMAAQHHAYMLGMQQTQQAQQQAAMGGMVMPPGFPAMNPQQVPFSPGMHPALLMQHQQQQAAFAASQQQQQAAFAASQQQQQQQQLFQPPPG